MQAAEHVKLVVNTFFALQQMTPVMTNLSSIYMVA